MSDHPWPYVELGLSKREVQIMERVAEGDSNDAIGLALHISAETVKSHIRHILDKLAAENRTHAVTICFRNGVVT